MRVEIGLRTTTRSVLLEGMRGKIGDRPWGATLATIGAGGHSGQLTLTGANHKPYRIAFANGVVVGASSPIAADSLARIALSLRLVSAAQAKTLGRTEDIERFAAAANLGPAQIQQLKRRVIIQRAARTFAVDVGTYVVEERVTMPVMLGIEVDIRAAIYEGIRMNLSQQRLTKTMHGIGSRFVLRSDSNDELAHFGFTEVEQPVLAALRLGTSVPDLEATRRDIDPRMAEAVILSLALCDALLEVTVTRVPTPREPTITRVPTPREPTMSAVPMMIRQDPTMTPVPPARAGSPRLQDQAETRAPVAPRTPTHRTMSDRFLEAQETSVVPDDRRKRTNPFLEMAATQMRPRAQSVPEPMTPQRPVPPPVPPPRRTKADWFLEAQETSVVPDDRRKRTNPFLEMAATRMRPHALTVPEVRELIAIGTQLLERGVDHFTFLGLPYGASADAVREAYLEFARYLRPEKLAELGIDDDDHDAHTVFAQVVIAFTVLSDSRRRTQYMATLAQPDAW